MTTIKRSAVVPYDTAEMYQLVNHVESYAEFLPWCKSSRVLQRTEDEVRATLVVSKAGLDKSFTTCNRLQRNKMIEIRLLDGPFKQLHGFWRFHALDEQRSRVSLDLEFELVSSFMDVVFGPVFTQIANSFVHAFCKRAITVYGYREIG
jgi:ribosome-associated toxin RatA of RatAB toxin-antitoxin module